MNHNELFDMDTFINLYEGMSLEELQAKRNQIISKVWNHPDLPLITEDSAPFRALLDMKIEIALLSKMIFRKYDEEFFKCPNCGLLCSIEEKTCRRCHHKL